MWEVNGPVFLLVIAIPIAIAILPLLVRGPAWPVVSVLAAVLLGLFAVLGSFTIGFYLHPRSRRTAHRRVPPPAAARGQP